MSERTLMSATVNVRPAEARTKVPRGRHKVTGRAWTPWVMLAPALVMLLTFVLYPAVRAIWLSLTSTNLINTASQKFVGFANYVAVFTNPVTYTALWHSAIWTFGNVFFQLVLGMIIALALNQKIRGRGPIRAIVLVPWATSSILVSLMWGWMLDPNLGIINHILHAIGVQGAPFAWLGTQATALPTLMFIDIWQGVPFFAVMILAALQGVPSELREAAKVDGANAWRMFWRVVFPFILPAVMITTLLRLIWTANYFDIILILTNGGPANATLTVPLFAYQTGYQSFNFGQAAALGVLQAGFLAILAVFYIRRIRKSELT